MLTIKGTVKKVGVAADGNVIDCGIAIEYDGETLKELGNLYGCTVEATINMLEARPPKAPKDPAQMELGEGSES